MQIMPENDHLQRAETYLAQRVYDEELLMALANSLRTYELTLSLEETFTELLIEVLRFSQSAFGFLAEVRTDAQGDPYLYSHAVTDIYKPNFTRYHVVSGLSFYNLNTLNGAILTSGRPVLSNEPADDPRSGGLPPGHAELESFLGVPFFAEETLVGACAVGNCPHGYDTAALDLLEHVAEIGGCLIAAHRA
ncbi:MAG: GAF domain-containing protein [Candidatus Latescibacterota bacterium]|jgi:GAF domain-containing protein